MNLTTQMAEYSIHLANNDSEMAIMQKMIIHLQGEIKILKSKLSCQTNKITNATTHKKK